MEDSNIIKLKWNEWNGHVPKTPRLIAKGYPNKYIPLLTGMCESQHVSTMINPSVKSCTISPARPASFSLLGSLRNLAHVDWVVVLRNCGILETRTKHHQGFWILQWWFSNIFNVIAAHKEELDGTEIRLHPAAMSLRTGEGRCQFAGKEGFAFLQHLAARSKTTSVQKGQCVFFLRVIYDHDPDPDSNNDRK